MICKAAIAAMIVLVVLIWAAIFSQAKMGIPRTMYANSEDFQVLAITTMVSSFVAEWNDQTMKIQSGVKGGKIGRAHV